MQLDFNALWREELKNEDGTYSPRMTDDATEREFWRQFMEKREQYVQDAWAVKMSAAVRELLSAYSPEQILEIGPGWGNFTRDLAKSCSRLTCIDQSPDVLNFLKRTLGEEGTEITAVCRKWEDFSPEMRYDAVFGYNCFYRMLDLQDCIKKMNQAADKVCIMGMGTGERKIYIYFINILFQMGIAANVRVVPLDEETGSPSDLTRRLGVLVYWEPVKE